MKLPNVISMSSPIVDEEDSCEVPEEKTSVEDEEITDLSKIF